LHVPKTIAALSKFKLILFQGKFFCFFPCSSSNTTCWEKPSSICSWSPCSFHGVLFLGQLRYHPQLSKCLELQLVTMRLEYKFWWRFKINTFHVEFGYACKYSNVTTQTLDTYCTTTMEREEITNQFSCIMNWP
jgi:hypothetical protein